jgi:hypothetical protein
MQDALPTSVPGDRYSMQKVIKTFNASKHNVESESVAKNANVTLVVPSSATSTPFAINLWYNMGSDSQVMNSFEEVAGLQFQTSQTPLFSKKDRSPLYEHGIVNKNVVLFNAPPIQISQTVSVSSKTRLSGSTITIMYHNGANIGEIVLDLANTPSIEELDIEGIGNGIWVSFNAKTEFVKKPASGQSAIMLTTGMFDTISDLKVTITASNVDTLNYWRQITITGTTSA